MNAIDGFVTVKGKFCTYIMYLIRRTIGLSLPKTKTCMAILLFKAFHYLGTTYILKCTMDTQLDHKVTWHVG